MKTQLTLALAALGLALPAAGQTCPADSDCSGKLVFAKTNTADSLVLKRNKPEGANEIPVPNFVVKSPGGNFLMTIGGQINPIIGADLGNNLYDQDAAGIYFMTQAIPVPSQVGQRSDFYINPLNAALDFQVVGLANTPNEITGYIKLAVGGNTTTTTNLTLNKAYISWRGFTMGEKETLFNDGNAVQPATIDPQGPSGSIQTTVYELSYRSPVYKGFSYALGIDIPNFYSSNGIYRGKDYPVYDGKNVVNGNAPQVIPDIPMWIQYGTGYNHIRLSGMIRNYAYLDLLAQKTRHHVGWGVALSGNWNPVNPLILYFQGVYGKGIGAYIQDLAGLPYSFVPNNEKPGEVQASPMMGVNFGLTYNITPKLQFNAMCSEAHIWKVGDYVNQPDATNYKYALYAAGNVFYNVTNYFQVGLEYLWGRRVTWDHQGANDSRIQAQFMFTL